MEKVINSKRDRLRKISQNKMMEGASIQGELIYMDIIKHLEHIGDFSMNIAHSLQDI
jgi:phosphate:Na+ symporter